MNRIIKYFVDNARLNYTLLALVFFIGTVSYGLIPKELFPNVTLNAITVSGAYAGASPQSLNNFAVTDIEEEITGIEGVKEVRSTIQSGAFVIKAELDDGIDPNEIIDEFKDAVALARVNFPADMNDPAVTILKRNRPLINLTLSSKTLGTGELLERSKELQTRVRGMEHISDVIIYGDADLQIDITLDTQKLQAYGLENSEVISTIQGFSYIYPVGNVDQKLNHVYISTQDGKTDLKRWSETLLSISGKKLYLTDVAQITIGYPQDDTISRFNGAGSITLEVLQADSGDAIKISEEIRNVIKRFEKSFPDTRVDVSLDRSKRIKDRLDTVTSNILMGLILVGLIIYYMISPRLAVVILFGVPFSFLIAIATLYLFGLSMNMVTLLALLITIGIVVDDAIIVSENIQRHLDEGHERYQAVLLGTKEVVAPVLIASATTVFAFMPMLLISGSMGAIVVMIPIVISTTIIASLLESFLFLPLHAKHLLKRNEQMYDWHKIYAFHAKVLHFLVHYKKSFLALFVIIIPVLTVISLKASKFQFFPRMDADSLTLSVQLDKSVDLEGSDALARKFEAVIEEHKAELFVKNVSTAVGVYRPIEGGSETIENAFTITIELHDFDEDNWIQNYLNPIFTLSFDFEQAEKIRSVKSNKLIRRLRKALSGVQHDPLITDLNILGKRHGVVRTDIELNLESTDSQAMMRSLHFIKKALGEIDGVVDISDNAKLDKKEYRFKINSYGASLGLTERSVAQTLSHYYLEKMQSVTLDRTGVVEIVTKSKQKDSLESLQNFQLTVGEKKVALRDVVDFRIDENFAKIEKTDLKTLKSIYANVDTAKVTAGEVLQTIQPVLKEVEKEGVYIIVRGESERRQEMLGEMGRASILAIFLIFIVLLINFNSFKMVFIILSVIPFTVLGALVGHFIMGMNLTFPSIIGLLGLAGVVINDGIVMLDFLKHTRTLEEFYERVRLRVRPILITSITTLLGLSTLIFYPSGQGIFLQPLAISLGFGLLWGTILNLLYLPALYAFLHKLKKDS